jgi:hypothetical protein
MTFSPAPPSANIGTRANVTPSESFRPLTHTTTMSTARRKDRRSNGRPRPSRARVSRQKAEFCTCRGQDDGRPMIHCSHCDDWFHFECVQLDQADAEEIGESVPLARLLSCSLSSEVYVCPPCQQSTGLRPVRECFSFFHPYARPPPPHRRVHAWSRARNIFRARDPAYACVIRAMLSATCFRVLRRRRAVVSSLHGLRPLHTPGS